MKTFLVAYFSSMVVMLAIDAVWLRVMSRRFYFTRLGELMSDSFRVAPAVLFYLLYVLGITLLVVVPAVNRDTGYLPVLLHGGLLGLVAYGTYDLTNQASLKQWPVLITVVDLVWGTLLTAGVSVASVAITGAL